MDSFKVQLELFDYAMMKGSLFDLKFEIFPMKVILVQSLKWN